jgi:hypothetical protein
MYCTFLYLFLDCGLHLFLDPSWHVLYILYLFLDCGLHLFLDPSWHVLYIFIPISWLWTAFIFGSFLTCTVHFYTYFLTVDCIYFWILPDMYCTFLYLFLDCVLHLFFWILPDICTVHFVTTFWQLLLNNGLYGFYMDSNNHEAVHAMGGNLFKLFTFHLIAWNCSRHGRESFFNLFTFHVIAWNCSRHGRESF